MKIIIILHIILTIIAVVGLLKKPKNPTEVLSWLYFIIFAPVIGPLIYLFFGARKVNRVVLKKWMLSEKFAIGKYKKSYYKNHVFYDIQKVNLNRSTTATKCNIISDLQKAHDEILKIIKQAKKRILIEYYIIENDEISNLLFDVLEQKVREGVDVYLIYDWLGSLAIDKKRINKLRILGARIAAFSPFMLAMRLFIFNLRNHRKLIVVDNEYAITGSANYGKTYLGKSHKQQNHDYIVVLEGEICLHLKNVFCLDWKFCTGIDIEPLSYVSDKSQTVDDLIQVQVVESGPHIDFDNLHETMVMMINSAKESIKITTPYLVPSEPVLFALKLAAKRGIHVEIIIPAFTDSYLSNLASSSYAKEMQDNSIFVYRYHKTFLHSKLMLIDNDLVLLGTPNLDCRSFRLNFELSLIISDHVVSHKVGKLFSEEIMPYCDLFSKRHSIYVDMFENFARLFSPQL